MHAAKRNNSIDIFRYFCAVLVVIIHTEPLYRGEYAPVGIFLKDYLARIAVPFFLTVSGYFFFHRIANKGAAWKYVWRLAKIYIIWSIPYFLINFWVLHDEADGIVGFVSKSIIDFFIFGSSSHFWFFPALIYSTLIISFLYKKIGFKPLCYIAAILFVIGCLGSSYLKIGHKIPLLSSMYEFQYFPAIRRIFMTGIPFMCLGGWLKENQLKLENISNKKLTIILTITILLYTGEKLGVTFLSLQDNLVNTIMLVPLVAVIVLYLLNNPAQSNTKLGQNAKNCANFMYYVHVACILILGHIFESASEKTFYSVIMFFSVVFITTVIGFLFSKFKIAKKLLG